MVANALAKWESDLANGTNGSATPKLSQKEMMDMLKAARGESNDKKDTKKSGKS